jgi:hypothetical protein
MCLLFIQFRDSCTGNGSLIQYPKMRGLWLKVKMEITSEFHRGQRLCYICEVVCSQSNRGTGKCRSVPQGEELGSQTPELNFECDAVK